MASGVRELPPSEGRLELTQEGWGETADPVRRPCSTVCQGELSPMFKPLTLSLSLAVALGACSVSMAGLFASPQCATPQSPCASSQSCLPSAQSSCLPKKHWNFHLPKPCFTYEWVLK